MTQATLERPAQAAHPFSAEYGHYINGEWIAGNSGETIAQYNPATGELLGRIQAGNALDAALAVKAAHDAFPAWSRTDAAKRQGILLEIGRRLKARSADFARMESLNNGKHIMEATHFDLPQSIMVYDYFAGAPHFAMSGRIEDFGDTQVHVHRQPLGVCAQIIPWNVPLLMMALKIAPALACGNTIVLKPAETTCLSVLELMKEIADLLPRGVLNILTGYGAAVGEALVTDPRVRKVAFTGSTATGRKVIGYAAKNIIPQTIELGGKSAQIICPSADLDAAVEGVTASTIFNKGEVCLAGSRVFVHESVKDDFMERLVKQIRSIRIGDPQDPRTQLGAQASQAQFDRVRSYLALAQEEGAHAVTGGKAATVEGLPNGFFIEPTILDNVRNDMRVAQEEIFGPVTAVIGWRDEDDVLRQANDSIFGLGGGVWTRDLSQAHRVARAIDTGVVWVNRYYNLQPGIATGGFKQSGFGREHSYDILESYTIKKSVVLNLAEGKVGFFDPR